MAALDDNEASRLLAASLGKSSYSAPTTPMQVALMKTNGSASSAGTEVSGGSYARQDVTVNSVGGDGSTANDSVIDFTDMPGTTVVGVEIYDSAASARRVMFGSLTTSRTTTSGDTLSFAVGSLTFTFT